MPLSLSGKKNSKRITPIFIFVSFPVLLLKRISGGNGLRNWSPRRDLTHQDQPMYKSRISIRQRISSTWVNFSYNFVVISTRDSDLNSGSQIKNSPIRRSGMRTKMEPDFCHLKRKGTSWKTWPLKGLFHDKKENHVKWLTHRHLPENFFKT